MLVRAAFIESAVCHRVKIRILADQTNNFVEMERRVRYGHPAPEDLLLVNKSGIRKTSGLTRSAGVPVFITSTTEKKRTARRNYIVMFFAARKTNRGHPSSVNACDKYFTSRFHYTRGVT